MSKSIRVLIVEDEFLTADTLKNYLLELGYQVSAMVRDAKEALTVLDEKKTDIAILDMNIQGSRDGIWLAGKINTNYSIPFIFLTAYSDQETVQYALETKPFGYLVKPFSKMDIYTALEVALNNHNKARNTNAVGHEDATKDTSFSNQYIFIKDKNVYVKVLLGKISYIKSELKYVEIHVGLKKYVLRYALSDFIKTLPNNQFIQVHRSYAVNKNAVEHIGANFLFVDGKKIPFSNSRKEEIIKMFKLL